MKSPIRLLIGGAAGLAAAAVPLVLAATAATAAPATVNANTHLSNRTDTCDCAAVGGVWAHDNMSRQFTVTPRSGRNYQVNITDNGTFAAIADPISGAPLSVNGSLTGTQSYIVNSATGPNASKLPSQIGDGTDTSTMILQDLFGGNGSFVGDGTYLYSYKAGGHTYTQSSAAPYAWGDIVAS
jgi:hypothetical protein